MSTVKAVAVHHTVSANGYSSSSVPAMIRGIYAYHTNGLGWCDIAYNVLVDRFGRLWEGRAGGLSLPVMSAATGGFNSYTSAVSAIGNFDTTSAPAAMVDSIARFASWKLGLGRVNPAARTSLVSAGGSFTQYPAGRVVGLPTIFGHRDSDLTACPGRYLYAQLATIRSKAFAYAGPSLFSPAVNYTRISTKDFPNFVVNAGTQRAQTWSLTVTRKATTTPIYAATGSSVNNRLSAIWPRTTTAGQLVGAGTYELALTSSTARAWTGEVTISGRCRHPARRPHAGARDGLHHPRIDDLGRPRVADDVRGILVDLAPLLHVYLRQLDRGDIEWLSDGRRLEAEQPVVHGPGERSLGWQPLGSHGSMAVRRLSLADYVQPVGG